jgi:phytoene dehydrogenase-like protein
VASVPGWDTLTGVTDRFDAVVVGAGPNGLTAAITIAQAGRSVLVLEGADSIGGGMRTAELTLPGFRHDICSAIHPLATNSPFMRTLPLAHHGLEMVHPELPMAHALEPERAVLVHRDIDRTAEGLGADAGRYRSILGRIVEQWPLVEDQVLGPIARPPRHPLAMARFGIDAIRPATRSGFTTVEGRALFAGNAAHAFLPLDHLLTASFGWFLLAGAHRFGWPAAAGGSHSIAAALASHLAALGGEIRTGARIESLDDLPPRRTTLLDLTPSGFARIGGGALPAGYLRKATRFRHGPAAFKLDYALAGAVPWKNPELGRAGTIHLGGTVEDIAEAERAAWDGIVHPRPFTLVVQPSMFDPTRAPAGRQTLWVYAHVPNGSRVDFTAAIERRLEEFAPGFRDLIVGRHVMAPADLETHNPNYVGGDIAGGAHTMRQLVFRPFPALDPYATPIDGVFLCSASTPPGAGTHGMCGHLAARSALEWLDR